MNNLERARKYYEIGKVPTDKVILKKLRDSGLIVYGAQAINAHLPDWLDKATEDWDIFSVNPEETAKKLEELLDKRYGGDYFEVKPAKHEGTFKVMNKVTLREAADISLPDKKIDYVTLDGINYTTLEFQVESIKKVLADPEAQYRHAKDTEVLQRIRVYRRLKPKKRKGPRIVHPITTGFKGFRD